MARGNAALQKNLAELELEIERLPERPSSYIHDDIDDGKVRFYQTARKIAFIKNLLTAEMDSYSGARHQHLNHMAMRLSVMEKTFVKWAIDSRFFIRDETLVNLVESGDGNGAVNKSSDMSASSSFTESCVVDEEFVEEDNVNQEAKDFGASETETILSEVSQVTERGRVECKEEGIEDEEEDERNQEEEKERKRVVGERTVEVNEYEKAGEQQQEGAEERDRDGKDKTVEKVEVEAIEEKGRWKQEGEMAGERKFRVQEDEGSERKEGVELVWERRAKEIDEAMQGEKSAEVKDEKEIEGNQERQMVGENMVEVTVDKKEERKEEGEMMGATMRGRERKLEAEMVDMQKIEVKEDEKGRERKQQSCRFKNCIAMGCAAAAGFAIALIGVAVANICWVEDMVYLVPT